MQARQRMSLGRHHGRTPVPELRAGVAGLRAWARQRMAGVAATWVGHVLEALEGHLGAVNTDKSWQPFVETIAFQVSAEGQLRQGSPVWPSGGPLVAAAGRSSENWRVWTLGGLRGPILNGFGPALHHRRCLSRRSSDSYLSTGPVLRASATWSTQRVLQRQRSICC